MSYDNMIKLIRPRTDEESILIWIDIPAINGGFVRDLLDSETTECIIQSEQNRVGFQNSVSKCMNQAEGFCPCRYNDSLQSMCKISATYIWNLNWGGDVSMEGSTATSGNVNSMRIQRCNR